MRTTIYIPDELVDEIKEEAWKQKLSVSGYLVRLHQILQGSKAGCIRQKAPVAPQDKIKVFGGSEESSDSESSSQPLEGASPKKTSGKIELSVREKYKLKFPNQLCPNCKNKNKDCDC